MNTVGLGKLNMTVPAVCTEMFAHLEPLIHYYTQTNQTNNDDEHILP